MSRIRLPGLLAIPLLSASLVLSGSAALAQDASGQPTTSPGAAADDVHAIAFDGFAFTFSEDLAASVNVSTLLRGRSDGVTAPAPPSTNFSLYGPVRTPRAGGQRGEIRLFRVADLPADGYAASELRRLEEILEQRPDLDPAAAGSPESIPLLLDMGAGQGIRTKATYVDTADASGIMFVTAFRQDTYPYSSDSFEAIFQGMSVDGTTAILARFPLTTQLFPEEVPLGLAERVATDEGWQRYQRRVTRTLDGTGPDAFSPPLASIAATVDSMTFASDAEPGPSPSAAPAGG